MARHSLSGFSKVFNQTFYTKEAYIKAGKFRFGDSFEVT